MRESVSWQTFDENQREVVGMLNPMCDKNEDTNRGGEGVTPATTALSRRSLGVKPPKLESESDHQKRRKQKNAYTPREIRRFRKTKPENHDPTLRIDFLVFILHGSDYYSMYPYVLLRGAIVNRTKYC